MEAEGLTFHQVKCVWNRKAPRIKGPLCMVGFSSLLFLVSAWWSVFLIYAKNCDSCVSLCEIVPAFVPAVSQLFFLWGSHVGNCSIYLQIDFCKTILSFRPSLRTPTPLPSTIWPFMRQSSLACFSAICLAVCVSGRPCDTVERTLGWVPGTWSSCPKSDWGPWKSHLPFSSEISLRSSLAPTFCVFKFCLLYPLFTSFYPYVHALYCHGFRGFIYSGAMFGSLHPRKDTS